MRNALLLVLVLTLPATAVDPPVVESSESYVAAVERAHGGAAWDAKRAVEADLRVQFGGNERFSGKLVYEPGGNRVRMVGDDGRVLVFDGERAWYTPTDLEMPPGPRFHLLTWTYFLAAPFKLDDPGAHLEPWSPSELLGDPVQIARLTFGENVGDTPDDWYHLYSDSETRRLRGMAYIVTYGKSVEQGEQEPHAIVYHDYETVDGVTLPMRWTFHHWSPEQGVHGEPIGEVTLENLRFTEPAAEVFEKPEGAAEDALPAAP